MQFGLALIGRILLGVIFLMSGFMKVTHPENVIPFMTLYKIPMAENLVYVAGVAELLGFVSLVVGFLTRVGAFGLFLYLIPTTLIFHTPFIVPYADRMQAQMQTGHIMSNLAIMGGLLYVTAFGAGAKSVDAILWKKKANVS